MANPTRDEILFRSGGAELARTGVPWLRGSRFDGREVERYTFTRADAATCATYVDVAGTIRKAAANKLRQSYDYGNSRYGLMLEGGRTNFCVQSESFGTAPWTAIGTPTLATAAASCGTVVLDLIGDDSGAATEGYSQAFATGVVVTGNNALSFFVAQGTTVCTSYVQWGLYDSTAATYRITGNLTAGSPTAATCTTGKLLAVTTLAGGVYRITCESTTCLAANGHQIRFYPAAGSNADTGNVYVGGVQLESTLYPTSYVATTTSSVTRASDALTFPIGFGPQDITVYVRMPRPVWADATGALAHDCGILNIGGDAATTGALLYGVATARTWRAWIGGQTADQSIPAGSTLELCAQFRFATDAKCKLDVGSGFGALSSAGTATFSNQTLRLGAYNVGAELDGAIERIVVARGLFTLAEMQSVAW